jgi:hypothetical protein
LQNLLFDVINYVTASESGNAIGNVTVHIGVDG